MTTEQVVTIQTGTIGGNAKRHRLIGNETTACDTTWCHRIYRRRIYTGATWDEAVATMRAEPYANLCKRCFK